MTERTIKEFYCPACNTVTDFTMYEEDGKPVSGECIRCDNTVELNDDGIWQHSESEDSCCPKCWDNSKDIDEQPQFKIQEWHAYQDGDMYYIQSDPEDEHYVASFENESDADDYCEYLKSKEVNKCEECGLRYEDFIKEK